MPSNNSITTSQYFWISNFRRTGISDSQSGYIQSSLVFLDILLREKVQLCTINQFNLQSQNRAYAASDYECEEGELSHRTHAWTRAHTHTHTHTHAHQSNEFSPITVLMQSRVPWPWLLGSDPVTHISLRLEVFRVEGCILRWASSVKHQLEHGKFVPLKWI